MLPPRLRSAGKRDAGATCAHCHVEIELDEPIAACAQCGRVHHEGCWAREQGCGSYGCAAEKALATGEPSLKISSDELSDAFVVPQSTVNGSEGSGGKSSRRERRPVGPMVWNRWSIASFVTALLCLGPIASILGVLALASRQPNHKGLGLALTGIILGLAEFIGISVAAGVYLGGIPFGQGVVIMEESDVDPSILEGLPEHIGRTMRSNVVIETQGNLGPLTMAMGSGVILRIENGTALIITNRHVIDMGYSGPGDGTDNDPLPETKLDVKMLGLPSHAGKVEWIAPYGIDLALITVAGIPDSDTVAGAIWDMDLVPKIGDSVFAVGNPHGLSWTHSEGKISQKRRQNAGPLDVELIQTDTAINSGNSGGGLYDAAGHLIGINTYTQDKRVAEGLGFAVSFKVLLDLVPDKFHLGKKKLNAVEVEAVSE